MNPNVRYFAAAMPITDRRAWFHSTMEKMSPDAPCWQRWCYKGQIYIDHNHPKFPNKWVVAATWAIGGEDFKEWQVLHEVNNIEEAIHLSYTLLRMAGKAAA